MASPLLPTGPAYIPPNRVTALPTSTVKLGPWDPSSDKLVAPGPKGTVGFGVTQSGRVVNLTTRMYTSAPGVGTNSSYTGVGPTTTLPPTNPLSTFQYPNVNVGLTKRGLPSVAPPNYWGDAWTKVKNDILGTISKAKLAAETNAVLNYGGGGSKVGTPAGGSAAGGAGLAAGGTTIPPLPPITMPATPVIPATSITTPTINFDDFTKGLNSNDPLEAKLLNAITQPVDYNSLYQAGLDNAATAFAPEVRAALGVGAQGANTINQFNQGADTVLGRIYNQENNIYNNAIGEQSTVSNAIGASLAGENPNLENQSILRNVGAPTGVRANLASGAQNQYGTIGPQGTARDGAGAVLSGLGNLAASSLSAQKAAALGAAAQLPALLRLGGQQALAANSAATSAAVAKVLSGEPAFAEKYAANVATGQYHNEEVDRGVYSTLKSSDNMKLNIASKLAQTQATQTAETARTKYTQTNENARATASDTLRAQSNAISARKADIAARNSDIQAENASTAAARANAYIYKQTHPNSNVTPTQATSIMKSVIGWRDGTPFTFTSRQFNKATGAYSSSGVTKYRGAINYQDAVARAGQEWGQSGVDYVNTVYHYGDGGRPLDPIMQQALTSAGAPQNYLTGKGNVGGKTTPFIYLNQKQAMALSHYSQGSLLPPLLKVVTYKGGPAYIINVG